MDAIREQVEQKIRSRASSILWKIYKHWQGKPSFRCIIAGGCLGDKINDVDLFPIDGDPLPEPINAELVSKSRNARTYKTDTHPMQLCSYHKATLKDLVEAFDYAHIQAGAVVRLGGDLDFAVEEICVTDAWITARATGTTWFVGSEYPLSSVIRAGKYLASGAITRSTHIRCVIDAMTETVRRGFKNYDDFKDQLDAVDLGMLSEEMDEVSRGKLMRLFELLERKP